MVSPVRIRVPPLKKACNYSHREYSEDTFHSSPGRYLAAVM